MIGRFYISNNCRYTKNSNPLRKEFYSSDGKTFICGKHGNWEAYVHEKHCASFFLREDARKFVRVCKKKMERVND